MPPASERASSRVRKRARVVSSPAHALIVLTNETSPLAAMHDLWKAGALTDIAVEVEGRTFHAHKLVLASASAYFQTLFQSDFADSTSSIHQLADMPAVAFAAILEFLYARQCQFEDPSLLSSLLEAGARLQIPSVIEAAGAAWANSLTPSTCLEMLELTDRLHLAELSTAAFDKAVECIEEAVTTPAFLSLSRGKLIELLDSDSIESEEGVILEALKRWITAHPAEVANEESICELLSLVRFAHMPTDKMAEVDHEPLVRSSVHAMSVVAKCYKEKLLGTGKEKRASNVSWLLDKVFMDPKVKVDEARVLSIHASRVIVPLARRVSSGTFAVRFKLLDDAPEASGVGFIDMARQGTLVPTHAYAGGPGLWWLRHYHGRVYAGETFVGEVGRGFGCPIGAEIRACVDMSVGEATFFVDGVEVPHKATGINVAVHPCVLSYSSDKTIKFELLQG